ncbi:carboxylesterase/lipase family protein [Subtercola sp. PAMC28395]|uniref:carboxylesterase/lipase family protein n=1 Tax=Subtercola sp. PAMC28395 TaxID=2846775 RepID=UPI001C0CE3FD|nr:carboxylesterase/lipase family protein [Subtercola sp. PAMC28395]QWT22970.1 carboxylesterase/lipase family protein [Subtercola sp. PAMC28395]
MTTDALVIHTTHGPVRGVAEGSVHVWKGIPFAAAPIGELRWRAPVAPDTWRDVRDATVFGNVCPQATNAVISLDPTAQHDEDCLNLNVWRSSGSTTGTDAAEPATGERPVPVMVWVHGGAYVFGASSQKLFDGASLVAGGEVILVTINYRLGGFGFLELTSLNSETEHFDTNLALRDVVLALEWVRDNIAAFGGDPEAVTLFGESAGGGIVTTLMTVPAAKGLFARAVAQSSPATSVYDEHRASTVASAFLEQLGVAPAQAATLRGISADRIVEASMAVFQNVPTTAPGTLAFAPVVDGDLVPEQPLTVFREGRAHAVPLIIGTNKDEAAMFKMMKSPLMPIQPDTIREMFNGIAAEHPEITLPSEAQIGSAYSGLSVKAEGMGVARDVGFRMPAVWIAEGQSAVAPVYLYRFDWATPMLRMLGIGATHATELPYLWGNLVSGPKDITFKLGGLRVGKTVSARMQERWLAFAVTGTPIGLDGEPEWKGYSSEERSTLVIDRHDRVVDDLDGALRKAWGDEVLSFV